MNIKKGIKIILLFIIINFISNKNDTKSDKRTI